MYSPISEKELLALAVDPKRAHMRLNDRVKLLDHIELVNARSKRPDEIGRQREQHPEL